MVGVVENATRTTKATTFTYYKTQRSFVVRNAG